MTAESIRKETECHGAKTDHSRLGLPLRPLHDELAALDADGRILRNITSEAEDSPVSIETRDFFRYLLSQTEEGA